MRFTTNESGFYKREPSSSAAPLTITIHNVLLGELGGVEAAGQKTTIVPESFRNMDLFGYDCHICGGQNTHNSGIYKTNETTATNSRVENGLRRYGPA